MCLFAIVTVWVFDDVTHAHQNRFLLLPISSF